MFPDLEEDVQAWPSSVELSAAVVRNDDAVGAIFFCEKSVFHALDAFDDDGLVGQGADPPVYVSFPFSFKLAGTKDDRSASQGTYGISSQFKSGSTPANIA
jgi:hypothetical protein